MRHMGFQLPDQYTTCLGRQSLNHLTSKEVFIWVLLIPSREERREERKKESKIERWSELELSWQSSTIVKSLGAPEGVLPQDFNYISKVSSGLLMLKSLLMVQAGCLCWIQLHPLNSISLPLFSFCAAPPTLFFGTISCLTWQVSCRKSNH